jgi:CSLREA domain-containing protein
MRSIRFVVPVLLLLVGVLALSSCLPRVHFTVDSTADEVDVVPGDGACATAMGQCTLRAAVQEASAVERDVTIDLAPAAKYILSQLGVDEDAGLTGDLDSSGGHITVLGHGSTIDGWSFDRVWDHHSGTLDLFDLTFTFGRVAAGGGCLRVVDGTVDLVRVAVINCTTTAFTDPQGAGIQLVAGTLNLLSTSVSGNDGEGASSGRSGGIYQVGGTLRVVASQVLGNYSTVDDPSSPGPGVHRNAGIYQQSGSTTVISSWIEGNTNPGQICSYFHGTTYCYPVSWRGYGIWAEGQLDVRASSVLNNTDDIGGPGAISIGATYYANCSATAVSSLGYNRWITTSCTSAVTDQAGFASVDQIPIGTSVLCDASTPRDKNGVSRPQGPACDIGPWEQ